MRPDRLVVVTGTATEVGKTWVTCRVVELLRAAGIAVAARKPVQSFDPADGLPTDAALLAAATGEPLTAVCPPHRSFAVPLAPPMAAEAVGSSPFTVADLVGALDWPDGTAVGLVEGAGGARSPLADDGDTVELARLLGPDHVVVVADAGLGAVNAVRLTVTALASHRTVVVLNRYDDGDDVHRRNRRWLVDRDGFDVVTSAGALARMLAAEHGPSRSGGVWLRLAQQITGRTPGAVRRRGARRRGRCCA